MQERFSSILYSSTVNSSQDSPNKPYPQSTEAQFMCPVGIIRIFTPLCRIESQLIQNYVSGVYIMV